MLIETSKLLPKSLQAVKTATIAMLIAASVGTMAHADFTMDRRVTVKIAASEFSSQAGLDKVYARLKDEAKAFCKSNISSLHYFGESIEECVSDLMDQFVTSADTKALTTYHEAMIDSPRTRRLASN